MATWPHIQGHSPSWFGTDTSIKIDVVNFVLWSQTSLVK
jgi:hypothetical protein